MKTYKPDWQSDTDAARFALSDVSVVEAIAMLGNTGNATVGSLRASNALPGIYTATCTDATHFGVTDPEGQTIGTGAFGSQFNGAGISFLVSAGSAPCAAGDKFLITAPLRPMILSDEEIAIALARNGWNDGLAVCATAMASYYAQEALKYKAGSGDVEGEFEKRSEYYLKLASLARQGAIPQPDTPVRVVTAVTTGKAKSCAREKLL